MSGAAPIVFQTPVHSLRQLLAKAFDLTADAVATESDIVVGTTAVALLQLDAQRIGFSFANNGTVPIFVGLKNTVTVATGFPILPSASMSLSWYIDLTTVGQDFYAISALAGQSVHVFQQRFTY